jgi:hypothetical protein
MLCFVSTDRMAPWKTRLLGVVGVLANGMKAIKDPNAIVCYYIYAYSVAIH